MTNTSAHFVSISTSKLAKIKDFENQQHFVN